MSLTPSPDTAPSVTYRSRYNREVLFNEATRAIWGLESTLPMDTEARRSLYRIRLVLANTWDNMDPAAKAAKYPAAPSGS